LLRPDSAALPPYTTNFAVEVGRLAEFISPALTAYLLHPATARYGRRLVAADPARESRLANRNTRMRLLGWAEVVIAAGIDVVFLNEFANAHTIYPDPDLRSVRDLDVLVALDDIKPLVHHLGGHGFRAADEDVAGAISLAANDGCTTLNLYLGISDAADKPTIAAAQVASASRSIELDGAKFRFPSPEHTLVLAASVAAKARFGRLCVRDLLDVVMLLRLDAGIDWPRVREIAGSSRLDKPLRTLLSLLVELGLGANGLPAKLIRPPRWPANKKFRHLVDSHRELFQTSGLRAGA
jgi:hypothetical protein